MSPSTCAACGLDHPGRFCPDCGEPVVDASTLTLGHLVGDVFRGLTDLDGRLWRTVKDLLMRPGALTVAWAEGPRSRYLPVASIFLTVTVLVFLAAPYIGLFAFDLDNYVNVGAGAGTHLNAARAAVEASPLDGTAWTGTFDRTAGELRRVLLVLLVPALALPVSLIAPRDRRPFAVHVVFALHSSALMLVWLTVVAAVGTTASIVLSSAAVRPGAASAATVSVLLGPILLWLVAAIRRVYGSGLAVSALRAGALVLGVVLVGAVYRETLFWVTLVVL